MFGWFRRRREARVREALIKQQAQDRKNAFVANVQTKVEDGRYYVPVERSYRFSSVAPNLSNVPRESVPSWYEIDAARQRREDENNSIGLATALVVESIIDSAHSYDPTPSYDSTPSYDPGSSTDYSSSFDSGSSGGAGGGSDW